METVLSATKISKQFPGVRALQEVSVEVRRGQVHALVGENGAGKSTLMKIISGVYERDSGTIEVRGREVEIRNPRDAQRLGISTIHQELLLVPELTVAANIFLGHLPTGRLPGIIDQDAMVAMARKLLGGLGVQIDPQRKVKELSVAERQLVEIAKALSHKADVVVMDEPTAALNGAEVKTLLAIVRQLKASGVGVVYISHRMEEIFAVCDHITVLRDGELVVSRPVAGLTHNDVVAYMVGRELGHEYPTSVAPGPGQIVLEVTGLTAPGAFRDVSFTLRAGEILGLAGLMGCGRSEVAMALFGMLRPAAGQIRMAGVPVRIDSPKTAIRHGMALVPADRKDQGLVLGMDVQSNATLSTLERLARFGLIDRDRQAAQAESYVKQLTIKTPGIGQRVGLLSGGNQQKVVIAKWLSTDPKVLILDEPTRGIDVGAKSEIHHLLRRLADQGLAVIVISSEMPELLGLSDRLLVMYEGRVMVELKRAEASEEVLNHYAHGLETR